MYSKDNSKDGHISSSSNRTETVVGDVSLWKMKYEILEEQHRMMKRRNEELEDRLLNLVEKVEQEKIILSKEIDQLVGRLAQANKRISALEEDCARYKKDCILAVNLLRCEPSRYIQQEKAPDVLPKKPPEKGMSVVRSVATFPPMAVYLPTESDAQPDDPAPHKTEKTQSLSLSTSFTSEFVEKIKSDENYSCADLKQCPKCDTLQATISRETQTIEPGAPWPKFVDSPVRSSTEFNIGEVI